MEYEIFINDVVLHLAVNDKVLKYDPDIEKWVSAGEMTYPSCLKFMPYADVVWEGSRMPSRRLVKKTYSGMMRAAREEHGDELEELI